MTGVQTVALPISITAPQPDPPAAEARSQIMQADLTRFSPAGPMEVTLILSSPNLSLIAASVSQVVFPFRLDASRILTSLSEIKRKTGCFAFPFTTI